MVYCDVQSTAQGLTKPKQPHWKKSARFCVNPRLPRKEENASYYISCLYIHSDQKHSLRIYKWTSFEGPVAGIQRWIRQFPSLEDIKTEPSSISGPESLFWDSQASAQQLNFLLGPPLTGMVAAISKCPSFLSHCPDLHFDDLKGQIGQKQYSQ